MLNGLLKVYNASDKFVQLHRSRIVVTAKSRRTGDTIAINPLEKLEPPNLNVMPDDTFVQYIIYFEIVSNNQNEIVVSPSSENDLLQLEEWEKRNGDSNS